MKTTRRILIALLALAASARALTVPVAEDTYSGSKGQIAPSSGKSVTLPVTAKQTAFVRFDTNDLNIVPLPIQWQNVNSAKLRLYIVSSNVITSKLTNAEVTVHAVTSEWHESFTGAPVGMPVTDATPIASIPTAELRAKSYVTVDITAKFALALKSGSAHGYALKTTDPKAKVVFASKEGAASGYSAEIEVLAGSGVSPSGSIFLGINTGSANTTGADNVFIGDFTGFNNTTGSENTFVGTNVGVLNTTGASNSFLGHRAGYSNTLGQANTFLGSDTGYSNTTGVRNTFTGAGAGFYNTTGSNNSFYGGYAGRLNTTGDSNSFFGRLAGASNTTGGANVFMGFDSGSSNTTEDGNTFLGASSNGAAGVSNATAIGFGAYVKKSDAVILGNNCDVGIRNTAPNSTLHVSGSIALNARVVSTTNVFVQNSDYVIVCTGATSSVVLPAADGIDGRLLVIKNRTGGNISIGAADFTETIDGAATLTLANNAVAHLVCKGGVWYKIN